MRRTHMLTQETTGWSELVAKSATMTALNHELDRWQDDVDESGDDQGRPLAFFAGTWPRTNVIDAGADVIVTAEVPGLTRDDVQLSLNANVLTLSGERVSVPQRYAVQHQERTHAKFSRSVMLPCEVVADSIRASVEHGVLTVTLLKAPEAREGGP